MLFWKYRHFIWQNGWRDLWYRYAGSSLGFLWHVLNPLFQIMIYTFVFSNLMKVRMPNLSNVTGFAIYLCSGLIPWIGFSEVLQKSCLALVDNADYLKKMAIPEAVFLARDAVSGLLGSLVALLVLVIVTPMLGHCPGQAWLFLPLVMLFFIMLAYGLGMALAALNVFFRDVGQFLAVALQVWFWATPIVYLSEIIPPRFAFVAKYNPAFYYIKEFHSIIIERKLPVPEDLARLFLISLISVVLGSVVLKRLESELKDCF